MVDIVHSEYPVVGGRHKDVVQERREGQTVHWPQMLLEDEVHWVLEDFPEVGSGLEEVFGSDVALNLLRETVLFEGEFDIQDVLGHQVEQQLESVFRPLE